MRAGRGVALAAALAILFEAPSAAAKKKPKASPKPTPAARPVYGPPAPVPAPLLRAAGSCLGYEKGQFLLLAEVGQHGRMFRIVPETVLKVEPARGERIRLLYEETPEGPVAREILPGPVAEEEP